MEVVSLNENERVRAIRKAKNLTLERFGAAVGVQKSAISKIERGENSVSDQIRLSICRAFDVNENWLRTGKGEMFLHGDDAVIAEVAERYHLSELDKEAFKLYLKLDEHERQGLMSFSFSLAGKILENPVLYRQYKQARGELPKLSKADIEVEVAAYRSELELLAAVEVEEETSARVSTKSPQEMSEAELHAELDRQLAEEKKQADGQSAFGPGNSEKATG